MDRRSFFFTLFGGMAAASTGALVLSQPAEAKPIAADALPEAMAEGLEEADAEFSHFAGPRHNRWHRIRARRRARRRSRRALRRARRRWRRGRWYYYY